MISVLTAVSSGTCVPYLSFPDLAGLRRALPSPVGGIRRTGIPLSRPLEGAADQADDAGHPLRYHGVGGVLTHPRAASAARRRVPPGRRRTPERPAATARLRAARASPGRWPRAACAARHPSPVRPPPATG